MPQNEQRPLRRRALRAVIPAALVLTLTGCAAGTAVKRAATAAASSGHRTIRGLEDFRKQDPKGTGILSRDHVEGSVAYEMSPPVGGKHNPGWQGCEGAVYPKPIPNERAVHSLEHGAVWITYRPELAKGQIEELAKLVRGRNYTMLSPYPGLDTPFSLQAWGVRLKLEDPADTRVAQFVKQFRESGPEPGAMCAGTEFTPPPS